MDRLSDYDLRPAYGDLLAPNVQIWAGAGWRGLITDALDQLAGEGVRISIIREKMGSCLIVAEPNGCSASSDRIRFACTVVHQAWERATRTCEACGAPGNRNRLGSTSCRCDEHQDEL
jgi:hypothetical protein